MSRIGKKTTQIPAGVTVVLNGNSLVVTGPKGSLTRLISPIVTVNIAGTDINLTVAHETDKYERSIWGTTGAHIVNMITGVTQGFKKQLEVNGVGYKVALQGRDLKLDVGYSHPVMYHLLDKVNATVEKNVVTLESIDIELLGQVAAEIRSIRKPEPYKGKGIKYVDEVIRRKAGKTAKSAG